MNVKRSLIDPMIQWRKWPTVCSLCLGAAAHGDTTRRYDTLNYDQREVQYPWHPLYGQKVIVCREVDKMSTTVIYCRLLGKEGRRVPAIARASIGTADFRE